MTNYITLDFSGLLPGIVSILAGLAVLALPEKIKNFGRLVPVAVPLLSFGLIGAGDYDSLAIFFAASFTLFSVLIGIYNLSLVGKKESAAILIYMGSTLCVALTDHWVTLVFFWELLAVAAAYLVWAGKRPASPKATLRYLMYHMLGGNLLLIGVIGYVASTGVTSVGLIASADGWPFWLIFAGICINVGMPPLGSWIGDAYPEATLGGTVYMNSFTTKVAAMAMIRVLAGEEMLIYLGVFMAIYGACMALLENNIRRLLAYHIISQLGYIVAACGVGGAMALDGAAAHAVNNIIFKGVLFMIAGAVLYATGQEKITQLRGLCKKMPFMAICFLICSLAIAGFPLLNGFASKALIMEAVDEAGLHLIDNLLILASVGTWLSIVMKINYFVFFGKTAEDDDLVEIKNKIPLSMAIGVAVGTGACLVIGLYPKLLIDRLPFGSTIDAFNLTHMADYLILFAGATAAFFICKKIMKPHEGITLDFDWLYRKPLYNGLVMASRFVSMCNDKGSALVGNLCNKGKVILTSDEKTAVGKQNGIPVGMIISALVAVLLVFVLVGFITGAV